MAETVRFYRCGCVTDHEEFCKNADKMVWMERDNAMNRARDHVVGEAAERAAWYEGYGCGWMNCHIGTQDLCGEYRDVPAANLEEPEDPDGEDPKAIFGGAG